MSSQGKKKSTWLFLLQTNKTCTFHFYLTKHSAQSQGHQIILQKLNYLIVTMNECLFHQTKIVILILKLIILVLFHKF